MRVAVAHAGAAARGRLGELLAAAGHAVAWSSADAGGAADRLRADPPDALLLDIDLAGPGLTADAPCPVLLVADRLRDRVDRVYAALGGGAVDAAELADPAGLVAKVATLAKLAGPRPARRPQLPPLAVLAASTGGPAAVMAVLAGLPARLPVAVVVVQHLDAEFAPGLAAWLCDRSPLPVDLIEAGRPPEPGRVLLAARGEHLVLDAGRRLAYTPEPAGVPYRPSADVFFASVAAHWPAAGVAALLSGMGRDGAAGLLGLRRLGWRTLAQDEATSAVWGMPRAAAEAGAAAEVLPPPGIAAAVAGLAYAPGSIHS